MNAGDTITIDTGAGAETRKIASIGTAAGNQYDAVAAPPRGSDYHDPRRLDQRAFHGPRRRAWWERSSSFVVGEKIALGYGATYPAVAKIRGEVRGGHGHRGRQAGHASLPGGGRARRRDQHQVTNVANISVGDKIRLDIDSVGHGIETVTVTKVGTQSTRGTLSAECERRRDQCQSPRRGVGGAGRLSLWATR